MSASDVAICSAACRLLGVGPISSFTENRRAEVCGELYDDRINELLASYSWRFSMRRKKLDRLTDAPENEWEYQHQLPTDLASAGVFALYHDSGLNQPVTKRWEMFGSKIQSNELELWCEYQVRPPEGDWPPHFYQLAIFAMASYLAGPLTEDDDKVQQWTRVTFGSPEEVGKGGYWWTATNLDAKTQPNQVVEDYSLIEARLGGFSALR